MGLSFLGDATALRAMDVLLKYSFLASVHTKRPQEDWGVFRSSRDAIFRRLKGIQMDG